MLVCNRPKFVYFMPPKTGTKSISILFENLWGCKDWEPHHGIHQPRFQQVVDTHPIIVSIRNPFSRAVSWWNHVRSQRQVDGGHNSNHRRQLLHKRVAVKKQPFTNFMLEERNKWRDDPESRLSLLGPITRGYWLNGRLLNAHHIRMESIRKDIQALPFVSRKTIPLPSTHRGKYPKGHWKKHYNNNQEVINFVREFYAKDFEVFRYSTEFKQARVRK